MVEFEPQCQCVSAWLHSCICQTGKQRKSTNSPIRLGVHYQTRPSLRNLLQYCPQTHYVMNLQEFEEKPASRLRCLRSEDEGRCATYELIDEDHTLGNALRHMILKNSNVKFCGYALPHPNERKINIQIQVYSGEAVDALAKGLKDLKTLNRIVKEKILKEKQRFGPVELEDSDEDEIEQITIASETGDKSTGSVDQDVEMNE